MGQLLLGYTAVAFGLVGLGRLAAKAIPSSAISASSVGRFWLGWAATLLFLQVWQLALPVDWRASCLLFVVGAGNWGVDGWRWWRGSSRRPSRPLLAAVSALAALAAAVLTARFAVGALKNFDGAWYHLPEVQWAGASRIVTGLGNLNPMLGLQGSHSLFLAALNVGPFHDRVHHFGDSLLVLALLVQGLAGLSEVLLEPRARAGALLATMLLPLAVDQLLSHDLVSASADLPVAVVTAVLGVSLVDWLACPPSEKRFFPGEVALLALAGSTLKLSFAATAGGTLLLVLVLWMSAGAERKRWTALSLAVLVLLGPVTWVVRSALLTGYPAFPSPALALPVAWRMPVEDVAQIKNYVIAWGRMSGGPKQPLIDCWSWVERWLVAAFADNRRIMIPMALTAIAFVARAVRRFRNPDLALSAVDWTLLPVLGGLGFWFVTSPDVRFAAALLWLLPAIAFVGLLARVSTSSVRLVMVAYAVVAVWPLPGAPVPGMASMSELTPTPTPSLRVMASHAGVMLQIPSDGYCWLAAGLCTPFPSPWLTEPGGSRTGFELESGHRLTLTGALSIPDYR